MKTLLLLVSVVILASQSALGQAGYGNAGLGIRLSASQVGLTLINLPTTNAMAAYIGASGGGGGGGSTNMLTFGAGYGDVTNFFKLRNATASRLAVIGADGGVTNNAVTLTEAGYLSGLSSAIQTQLDSKAPLASPTFTGTATAPTAAISALIFGAGTGTNNLTIGSLNVRTNVNAGNAVFTNSLNQPNVTVSRLAGYDSIGNLTNLTATTTEANYLSGVTSALQTQLGTKAPLAAPAFTGSVSLSALTASRALVSDGASPPNITNSTVTATELGYVSGVTSAIQTQINSKAASDNWSASGTTNSTLSGNATAYSVTATNSLQSIGTSYLGVLQSESDAGIITLFDVPIVAAASSTLEGYDLKIGSSNMMSFRRAASGGAGVSTNGTVTFPAGVQVSMPGNTNYAAYSAGTAYTVTTTAALADFGTTDPTITVGQSGTYALFGSLVAKYNAATYAGAQTLVVKIRRTNNTAADVTSATTTVTMPVLTTFTGGEVVAIPSVDYVATQGDILQVFVSYSADPAAGTVTAESANIVARRIF